MRVIFLFLDGVGIGPGDPKQNPLAAGDYPVLAALMQSHPLTDETTPGRYGQVYFAPLDAQMGVDGRPQSATGQAALLSGLNAPALVGEHYGPRPDDRVRAVIDRSNLFAVLHAHRAPSLFSNAYPQGYFDAVNRGKRLLSVLPYAATQAGQALLDARDYYAGHALAADFTGAGWREQLGYLDAPVLSLRAAGHRLWALAHAHQFVLFEHWLTDFLGHRRQFHDAIENFRRFDAFLGGLLEAVGEDLANTLIVVASDHGNVEDCSHGKHTENPALGLFIGGVNGREIGAEDDNGGQPDVADAAIKPDFLALRDLTDVTPFILRFLNIQTEVD